MPAKSYADGIAILLWEREQCAGSQRGCVFGMMAVKTIFGVRYYGGAKEPFTFPDTGMRKIHGDAVS